MTQHACDLIIENGIVVNGSGAARIRADVAVSEGRIAAVGKLAGWDAETRIDAAGRIVAPGFIDAHTHDDQKLLEAPDLTPKVSQGVTTVIVGNCGIGLPPLQPREEGPPPPLNLLGGPENFRFPTYAAYAEALEKTPAAVNSVVLAGHSALRAAVMDDLDRPATNAEIEEMAVHLDEALDAGCAGFSTGLAYATAIAAPAAEVTALAKRLKPAGGLFSIHVRDESDGILESIEETLSIARDAEVPVVISHHKCCARANWGKTRETLAMIDEARKCGDVAMDTYPYTASSTILLPHFAARAERTVISWSKPHPEMTGRDLAEVIAEWETGFDEAVERLSPAGAIYFQMDEDDLQRVLKHPRTMIGSDGLPHDVRPHPRLWGTFARVLGHYVRDVGLYSLEEAVHRMTGLPASVYGLRDRGRIAAGAAADIVIFDEETIADRATYEAPETPAEGISRVLVNGETIWRDGGPTGARPGRMLRRGDDS